MADFITADLHLGHRNIIKYCNRPFSSFEEMDSTIINNINDKVGVKDRLIVVGDFCLKKLVPYYLNRINCKRVWLIKGNHDKKVNPNDGFEVVKDYHEETYDLGEEYPTPFVMCHYPMLSWNKSHYGSYMIHGHCHGTLSGHKGLASDAYRIDVGVDCHDFQPLTPKEIAKLMKTIKLPLKEHSSDRYKNDKKQ